MDFAEFSLAYVVCTRSNVGTACHPELQGTCRTYIWMFCNINEVAYTIYHLMHTHEWQHLFLSNNAYSNKTVCAYYYSIILKVNFPATEHFVPSVTYPIKAFKTNAVITSLPPKSRTCISCKNRKKQILITLNHNLKGECEKPTSSEPFCTQLTTTFLLPL